MALGTSASAEVFKHLGQDEIERLSAEIVRVREVHPGVMQSVMAEFERMTASSEAVVSAKKESPVAGPDAGIAKPGSRPRGKRPLEALAQAEARRIADTVRDEQPGIIAVLLTHLPLEKAGEVLAAFDADTQSEIARCICEMGDVSPEVPAAIEEALQTKLTETDLDTGATGVETLVEILNNADSATGSGVLQALGGESRTLADEVRGRMFVFDDLPRLDDRSLQHLLREVSNEDLPLALKGAEEEIRRLIFRNMSERAAETLGETLESSGPIKIKAIEASQRRIAALARHLIARGEIAVNDADEEKVA
jgi:flagellar motor switch protein FliG